MMNIKLKLLSDTHIGNGLSDGIVDSDYDRDRGGAPRIKGSVLKGLLRESCADLLECLGDAVPDARTLLEEIFGKCDGNVPAEGKVLFPVLIGDTKKRIVTGHTQINPETGTAAQGRLFLVAHAPAGLEFEGSLDDLGLEPNMRGCASALLSLGLLNLEGIGGKRRSGKGRIQARPVEWFQHNQEELANAVDGAIKTLLAPIAAKLNVAKGTLPLSVDLAQSNEVCALDLTFTALSPVCIPDGPPTGNRFGCLGHIPATVLAGAFFGTLKRKKYNEAQIDRLVASRSIGFPTLHPLVGENSDAGNRFSFPWPLSLERCKKARGEEGHHFEDALGKPPRLCPKCNGAVGPEPGGAILRGQDKYLRGGIAKTLVLHNRIERKSQTTGDNGVFTLEAIQEGTVFVGRIFFACPDVRTLWMEALADGGLNAAVSFGKGRSRGYGYGRLSWTEVPAGERGLPGFSERIETTKLFSLMLLSQAIVLSDSLSLKCAPDGEDLTMAIGSDKAFCKLARCEGAVFSRAQNIFSFNSHRAMPEIPECTLTPGSVFLYEWEPGIPDDEKIAMLAKLECCGLGERRNLGYGRVMVNPLSKWAGDTMVDAVNGRNYRRIDARISQNAAAAWGKAEKFIRANLGTLRNLPKPSQLKDLAKISDKKELQGAINVRGGRVQERQKWLCMTHDPELAVNLPFKEYLLAFADKHSGEGIKLLVRAMQEAEAARKRNLKD